MTEQDLIKAHGVKVGQIWVRDAPVPLSQYEMEVVYVTVAFCVLHSTSKDIGLECIPSIAGVEGRFASPFTETISRMKSGWKMVKDAETKMRDKEVLAAAIRIRSTIGRKCCPWECEAYIRTDGRSPMAKYQYDLELVGRQFLHEHASDLPEE